MTDLFFYLSKLLWFIVQPDHLLLLMLTLGLFLWKKALGVFLVWCSVLLTIVVSQYPVANHALEPLESYFSKPNLSSLEQPLAGIIVLGGGEDAELSGIHGSNEFNSGAERLMVLPALMLRNPKLQVIYTGGSGSIFRPGYRGADVAQNWLSEQGLAGRLIIERDSRNTYQNALYTRELINELGADSQGSWLLITSAFHMPRSVGVFRKAGIDVVPYPVDYRVAENRWRPSLNRNMADLNLAVREWIGLLAYYYTDKTDQILPLPSKMNVLTE
ncbi:YdcF family protein [Neptuniibacter caesariensis]|uniref:DUF218 domain-containing protein n=1 Tax=Neptuniibacter caesariensis TaxID=207954 RepID=A0A7U8GSW7_NEPCE|nr:YdcF family protein [Neptuniibacter caesariensis]EAR62952.1 hypothetical protein MED92_07531 [Oceanospirillum sp. MED92] [Neptuniibacter caesariensis]